MANRFTNAALGLTMTLATVFGSVSTRADAHTTAVNDNSSWTLKANRFTNAALGLTMTLATVFGSVSTRADAHTTAVNDNSSWTLKMANRFTNAALGLTMTLATVFGSVSTRADAHTTAVNDNSSWTLKIENNNDNQSVTSTIEQIVDKAARAISKNYYSVSRQTEFALDNILSGDEYQLAVNNLDQFVNGLEDSPHLRGLNINALTSEIKTELQAVHNIIHTPSTEEFLKNHLGGQTTYWAAFAYAQSHPNETIAGSDKTFAQALAVIVKDLNLPADTDLKNIAQRAAVARRDLSKTDHPCTEADFAKAIYRLGTFAANLANGKDAKLTKDGKSYSAPALNVQMEKRLDYLEALFLQNLSGVRHSRYLTNIQASLQEGGALYNLHKLSPDADVSKESVAKMMAMFAMKYTPYAAYKLMQNATNTTALTQDISAHLKGIECDETKRKILSSKKTLSEAFGSFLVKPGQVQDHKTKRIVTLNVSEVSPEVEKLVQGLIGVIENNTIEIETEKEIATPAAFYISTSAESAQKNAISLYSLSSFNEENGRDVVYREKSTLFNVTGGVMIYDFADRVADGKDASIFRFGAHGGIAAESWYSYIPSGSTIPDNNDPDAANQDPENNDNDNDGGLGDIFGGFGDNTGDDEPTDPGSVFGQPDNLQDLTGLKSGRINTYSYTLGLDVALHAFKGSAEFTTSFGKSLNEDKTALTTIRANATRLKLSGELGLVEFPILLGKEYSGLSLSAGGSYTINGLGEIHNDEFSEAVKEYNGQTFPANHLKEDIRKYAALNGIPNSQSNTAQIFAVVKLQNPGWSVSVTGGLNNWNLQNDKYVGADGNDTRAGSMSTYQPYMAVNATLNLNRIVKVFSKKSANSQNIKYGGNTVYHAYEEKSSTGKTKIVRAQRDFFLLNSLLNINTDKVRREKVLKEEHKDETTTRSYSQPTYNTNNETREERFERLKRERLGITSTDAEETKNKQQTVIENKTTTTVPVTIQTQTQSEADSLRQARMQELFQKRSSSPQKTVPVVQGTKTNNVVTFPKQQEAAQDSVKQAQIKNLFQKNSNVKPVPANDDANKKKKAKETVQPKKTAPAKNEEIWNIMNENNSPN